VNEIGILPADRRASYTGGKARISTRAGAASTRHCYAQRRGETGSQEIHRALDAPATTVEHMGVDHRGLHALVPEELLHGPNVVAVHQKVRGKGMAQGVAGRRLDDACRPDGLVERLLDAPVVQVMPAALSGPRIARQGRSRKRVLPPPLGGSVRIFSRQRARQVDSAVPVP
jgi:hypothetical protein